MLKRIYVLFFAIILMFSCCTRSTTQDIIIADYKNIKIPKEYVTVTEEEIEINISLDLSSSEIYKPTNKSLVEEGDIVLIEVTDEVNAYNNTEYYFLNEEEEYEKFDNELIGKYVEESFNTNSYIFSTATITILGIYSEVSIQDEDIITDFYGFETIQEVKKYIENRIYNNIVFYYMWDNILENSKVITFSDKINTIVSEYIEELYSEAHKKNKEAEKYIFETYGFEIDEIKQNLFNYYFEIAIMEAVLSSEHVSVTKEMIDNTKQIIAIENDIALDEIYDYFDENDIYYRTLLNELKVVLVPYINIVDE